ncbi:hypothetical protein [Burkholderia ubonensis]|nr:hypothetical protein [Burkholderia ubonensis]
MPIAAVRVPTDGGLMRLLAAAHVRGVPHLSHASRLQQANNGQLSFV